jgi:hypothetical protein
MLMIVLRMKMITVSTENSMVQALLTMFGLKQKANCTSEVERINSERINSESTALENYTGAGPLRRDYVQKKSVLSIM